MVAIRDGKTTSETIRSTARRESKEQSKLDLDPQIMELEGHEAGEKFVELSVLDSAGHLHIPAGHLHIPKDDWEYFGLQKRVRLELREDSIAILPFQEADKGISAEDAVNQLSELSNQHKLISKLKRWWSERGQEDKAK